MHASLYSTRDRPACCAFSSPFTLLPHPILPPVHMQQVAEFKSCVEWCLDRRTKRSIKAACEARDRQRGQLHLLLLSGHASQI